MACPPGQSDQFCELGKRKMADQVQVNVMTAKSPTVLLRKDLPLDYGRTWNVRSLYHGKLHMICNEMERTKTPILGITEHRWAGQGHFKTSTGDTVIYSGKAKSEQSGVGFILAKQI
uniref:Uncharacterized protein n=1 Tax=Arion vulgaris TaxID=1028688 RepID=A0A0B6ZZU5_9EUPU